MNLKLPKNQLAFPILALVIWRVILFVVSGLAGFVLAYRPSFPYAEVLLLNRQLPAWLASWGNFDGVHYITIVEKGYLGTGLIQAFFPLYPLLTWAATLTSLDTLLSGLLVSHLAFGLFLVVLYRYTAATFTAKQANWTIAALLLFPTAFFFGSMYTESLFMLLVIGSLWAGQKKQWLLASCLAALASATRLVGIFLLPALVLELFQSYLATHHPKKTFLSLVTNGSFWVTFFRHEAKALLTICLSCAGLLAYMVYLHIVFHDPLYFYHVQSEFGSGRQESLVLLPQVLWRYLKILLTYRPFDFKYYAYVQELIATIFGYLVVLLAAKKVRWSFTFFSLLALTLPTLTGTLSSMPRYILAALPLFWFISYHLSSGSKVAKMWLIASALLLVVNTLLFIQGYWVA